METVVYVKTISRKTMNDIFYKVVKLTMLMKIAL